MTGLDISHLQKRYGDQTVVDDLSFHVNKGEIFGLIGPNGAGKSTSIMMIIGLLQPDGGSISFDGQLYNPRNAEMRSRFGIVPQELAIYPQLSAIQNLLLFGKLNGLGGRRLRERVDYVLEITGLGRNADQTPQTFSGGMSRRLNFGIALLHEPAFVVLDEPTVGIDPQSRTNLLDAVRDLSTKGVGVLYASHYMEEVEAICHRVAIIDRGRLLKQGTIDDLLDRTQTDICVMVAKLPIELIQRLHGLADVRSDHDGNTTLLIRERLATEKEVRPGRLRVVLELLEQAGVPMLAIKSRETSLESLFMNLTGRTLRD
jgi:ABC-2 type transport system ATP-binding protein